MTAWLLDTGPLVAFFDRSDADDEVRIQIDYRNNHQDRQPLGLSWLRAALSFASDDTQWYNPTQIPDPS